MMRLALFERTWGVAMRTRGSLLVALVLIFTASVFAADPKIERIGPFEGNAPDVIKNALDEAGYRVTGTDGKVLAEIWPAKAARTAKGDSADALYPDFVSGTFYGVLTFPNGAGDFREQKIATGTYVLRYQLLPADGNHLGVAPNPDFFLLTPLDADTDPSAKLASAALVRLSTKASGTAHPAVFALSAPDTRPFAAKQDQSHTIAYFSIKTASGPVNVGMILSGSAD